MVACVGTASSVLRVKDGAADEGLVELRQLHVVHEERVHDEDGRHAEDHVQDVVQATPDGRRHLCGGVEDDDDVVDDVVDDFC